jgi:hypothetical protein
VSTGATIFEPIARRQAAGDLNGDGTIDYVINYPNGEVQSLYVYPPQ